jgi:hypothetical protein
MQTECKHNENTFKAKEVVIRDLYKLMVDKFIHNGIYISTTKSIDSFIFDNQLNIIYPKQSIRTKLDNLISHPLNVYDFKLDIMTDQSADDNKIVSKLMCGAVTGNCFIASKTSTTTYDDLDIETIYDMLYVAPEDKTMLGNQTEMNEINKLQELEDESASVANHTKVNHKFKILYNMVKKFVAKCGGCDKVGKEVKQVCGKCHRVKYCSRECQVSHWKTHMALCNN